MPEVHPQTQHPQRHFTPKSTSNSPLEYPLLASSPLDMNVFRAANEYLKNSITTNSSILPEEREHINRLTRSSEKFVACNTIREQENVALREVVNARKNCVAGKRGILKGQHCVTKSGLYTQLAGLKRTAEEKAEAAKNRKRKGKSKSDSVPEPTIDPSLTLRSDRMEVSDSDNEE